MFPDVNSLYSRLGLSWNKLVYVDATGRNDWSSTLNGASAPSSLYPPGLIPFAANTTETGLQGIAFKTIDIHSHKQILNTAR